MPRAQAVALADFAIEFSQNPVIMSLSMLPPDANHCESHDGADSELHRIRCHRCDELILFESPPAHCPHCTADLAPLFDLTGIDQRTGTIESDRQCRNCGYNLRTLNWRRCCPECNRATIDSLKVPRLPRSAMWGIPGFIVPVMLPLVAVLFSDRSVFSAESARLAGNIFPALPGILFAVAIFYAIRERSNGSILLYSFGFAASILVTSSCIFGSSRY